jgi:hypothetical protein
VRILPVAQRLRELTLQHEGPGSMIPAELLVHVARNHRVVACGMRVDLGREPPPRFLAEPFAAQPLADLGVVGRITDDRDVGVVLRCRTQHRRPADIDLLDRLGQRDIGLGDRSRKRVEVDDHEVDVADAMLLHRAHVLGEIAPTEQAAVHERVQRLDAPIEHLGEARVLGHVLHLEPSLAQRARRAPRRKQAKAALGDHLGEVHETGLVRDRQQCIPRSHDQLSLRCLR